MLCCNAFAVYFTSLQTMSRARIVHSGQQDVALTNGELLLFVFMGFNTLCLARIRSVDILQV